MKTFELIESPHRPEGRSCLPRLGSGVLSLVHMWASATLFSSVPTLVNLMLAVALLELIRRKTCARRALLGSSSEPLPTAGRAHTRRPAPTASGGPHGASCMWPTSTDARTRTSTPNNSNRNSQDKDVSKQQIRTAYCTSSSAQQPHDSHSAEQRSVSVGSRELSVGLLQVCVSLLRVALSLPLSVIFPAYAMCFTAAQRSGHYNECIASSTNLSSFFVKCVGLSHTVNFFIYLIQVLLFKVFLLYKIPISYCTVFY